MCQLAPAYLAFLSAPLPGDTSSDPATDLDVFSLLHPPTSARRAPDLKQYRALFCCSRPPPELPNTTEP